MTLVAARKTCWRCHRVHRHRDLESCVAEYLHGALRHLVDSYFIQGTAGLSWLTKDARDAADMIDGEINRLQRALEVRDDACQRKTGLSKVP